MDEAGEVMGVVGIGTVVDLGAKEEEVFGERRWVSWGSRHFGWEWDIGKGRKGMERGEGYWYGEIGVVGGWGVEGGGGYCVLQHIRMRTCLIPVR